MTNSGWLGLFLIFVSCSIWAARAHDLPIFIVTALFAIWSFGSIGQTSDRPPT